VRIEHFYSLDSFKKWITSTFPSASDALDLVEQLFASGKEVVQIKVGDNLEVVGLSWREFVNFCDKNNPNQGWSTYH